MDFTYEKEHIFHEEGGRILAEINFPGGCITHTFVDKSLRGRGIAAELVKAAAKEIEKQGMTPTAACSYAAEWLERNQ